MNLLRRRLLGEIHGGDVAVLEIGEGRRKLRAQGGEEVAA